MVPQLLLLLYQGLYLAQTPTDLHRLQLLFLVPACIAVPARRENQIVSFQDHHVALDATLGVEPPVLVYAPSDAVATLNRHV